MDQSSQDNLKTENSTAQRCKKCCAKGKITMLIIGVLLGAVVASAAFLIAVKTLGVGSSNGSSQMGGGEAPSMPSGQGGSSNSGQSEPPAKPGDASGTSSSTDTSEPPAKPSEETTE